MLKMSEKTQQDIDALKELVDEAIAKTPTLSKEDAIFEITAIIIESSVAQSKAIDNLAKTSKILIDRVRDLEMRLTAVEAFALPLLKDAKGIAEA
jgi:hypothetical protein